MARKGVVYQQGQPFSAGSVLVNTDRLIVGVIGTANSSPSGASFAPPPPPPRRCRISPVRVPTEATGGAGSAAEPFVWAASGCPATVVRTVTRRSRVAVGHQS